MFVTGQRSKPAVINGAIDMPAKEESIGDMEGRKNITYAIMKTAPNISKKEDRRTSVLSAAKTTIMPWQNEKLEPPLRKVQPGDRMTLTTRATHPKSPTPKKLL